MPENINATFPDPVVKLIDRDVRQGLAMKRTERVREIVAKHYEEELAGEEVVA